MSKYCVIGRHGLLGGTIAKRLGETTSFPQDGTKVIFDFASYTHPQFELNPDYHMKQAFDRFASLLPYCHQRGILYVYPSSALVYEKESQFSRFKKTLESMAACYKTVSLGLRIFPVYGPGESTTVISQWCRQMARGEAPLVYGDGSQKRDFIYIDDAVDQILSLVDTPRWSSRIVDIGTGVSTSFLSIINTINQELGTRIAPKFSHWPENYPTGILCPNPLPSKVCIEIGVRRILASLKTEPQIDASLVGGPLEYVHG
jgi:nucleoside-diphosphate-sugar epimerase